jgi:DNA ligase-associated metallophosphoesterase
VTAPVTITVGGQQLLLLPEKAALLPESDTLLVADAHIGRAVSMREFGLSAADGTTSEALTMLSTLVERLGVRRIVFLGDFLHPARLHAPATLDAVTQWREAHFPLELTLVRSERDGRAADPPAHLGIETVNEPLIEGGLAICHHPRPQPDLHYVLAGHLRPCVSLRGRENDWERVPCFWFRLRVGVLPAFGAFTGMQAIRASNDERVFAATRDRVVELRRTRA